MLAFTECMRDHGVDMPDPQMAKPATGGAKPGNAVIAVEGDPDDPTFQEANEACEPLMANVRSDIEIDPERQAEMKEQMLEFAAVHARPRHRHARPDVRRRTGG